MLLFPNEVNPNCNLPAVIEDGDIVRISCLCNCPLVPVTKVAVSAFPLIEPTIVDENVLIPPIV